MRFDRYAISDEVKDNLTRMGFKRPTDIQFRAIPSIFKGEDVFAVAQTGTGKTAAFAIPIVDRIHREKSGKRSVGIRCLVLVPTRELCEQIGGVFSELCRGTRVRPFALFGGVEQDQQVQKLEKGLDILVATPGRMFDLIKQGFLLLDQVRMLVLDEADRMLDLGFIEDIRAVKRKLPQRHQTLFFSATIHGEIKKLAYSLIKGSAIRIQLSPEDPVSKNISHHVLFVDTDDKRFFLERYRKENPEEKILVFVRTRVRAERVAAAMERVEIPAVFIHGGKDQKERFQVMKAFREGNGALLIATDVSSRGIDIPDVDTVINYDLPEDAENYVHRIGRTGRGVRKGLAISFCSENERDLLSDIEALLGHSVDVLSLDKGTYAETLLFTGERSLEELIRGQEAFEARRKKKKKV